MQHHDDVRSAISAGIDHLIDILDFLDGDTDREPDSDLEPSLGAYHGTVVDGELDDADFDPNLGSLHAIDQCRWALGGTDDLERDNSDREPELGSLGAIDQELWASGTSDREEENEHGGDVQDEPHDLDVDLEPMLGSIGSDGEQSQEAWSRGMAHYCLV